MSELINKYRPVKFDQVVGHTTAVKSIQTALSKGLARTFLFTGPSGVGKTTLARIIAAHAGCRPEDLNEIDAATNTGVEDMRNVTASLDYRPLGEGSIKALIVDECHSLSKNAWQSLLKNLEEPQPWVYWFLCTTEATKVPATIKTRALHCDLKPVKTDDLVEWLADIAFKEQVFKGRLDDDTTLDVIALCAGEAEGSPRQALSNLVACLGAGSYDDAKKILRSVEGSAEAADLAKALLNRASWPQVQAILAKLKDINPESVRQVVRAYMTSVIVSSKHMPTVGTAMEVLDVFSTPFYSQDGMSPVVLAAGKVVLSR